MSKRSRARNSARQAAVRGPGSHLTRRNRACICERAVRTLFELGYQVKGLQSLRVQHVVKYIEKRKADGIKVRSLQNEMSALRVALREAGRDGLADHKLISNAALGISGASHRGTNTSVTPQEFELLLEAARACGIEFVLACELMRYLGLRALEVVCSGGSLKRWRKELRLGHPVHVIRGTKGGRPRWVQPVDAEKALAAVELALKVLRQNRRAHLLPGTLKQAIGRFNRVWFHHIRLAAGRRITPHSLRYSYAQDIETLYLSAGYSASDAKGHAALCLGHGDGRGRLLNSVYGQRPPALANAKPGEFQGGAAPAGGSASPESSGMGGQHTYQHVVCGPTMGGPMSRFGNPTFTASFGTPGDGPWLHSAVSFGGRIQVGYH